MPRLIDDIRAPEAKIAAPLFVRRDREDAWEKILMHTIPMIRSRDLPVLLIDNVAEYYYTCEQEYWDLSVHFPNLAPPYPCFWAEHKLPRKIHSKECGDTETGIVTSNGRSGCLVTSLDPAKCNVPGVPENAKWILWCELFADYGMDRSITAQGPHGSMFIAVDAEGRIVGNPWIHSLAPDSAAEIMRGFMTWLNPTFLAVSFLHCKNVSMVDNKVDAPLAKKWASKHGGLWPTRYKTLIIEPLKQILRREGGSDKVGVPKAMHICRGHFRDYREGRGLFGKLHGQFYIPATVRGTKGDKAPPREIEVKV
jgi:hypothetical protein